MCWPKPGVVRDSSDFPNTSSIAPVTAIRAELPEDAGAVHDLLVRCFPTAAEATLARELRQGGDVAFSFVAIARETVVGHVLFSRLLAPKGSLALAPVAVDASWRRQGVAASLIRAGLDLAKARGATMVVVLGDPAYYRRFGFRPETVDRLSCRYAGPNLMGLAVAADNPVGNTIEYPPAFESV